MVQNFEERHSLVLQKAEDFAVRMVNSWKHMAFKMQEHDMSRQAKRSGTSVGANIAEALSAASKRDFLNKIYIAFKECSETKYWLRIMQKTEYLSQSEFDSIYGDACEIERMLTTIIRTTKINLSRESLTEASPDF